MENIKMKTEGSILKIEIDLSKQGSPSATGKTMVVASTRGNQKIADAEDTFIGINVYRKR